MSTKDHGFLEDKNSLILRLEQIFVKSLVFSNYSYLKVMLSKVI